MQDKEAPNPAPRQLPIKKGLGFVQKEVDSGPQMSVLWAPSGVPAWTGLLGSSQLPVARAGRGLQSSPPSSGENLPPVQETQETWVGSLGPEGPLEEGMATHSSILA